MTAPVAPRRRDSDHPRRRLEDAPGHRRLLHLIVAGVVIGALTVLIALGELRYRDSARTADLRMLTDLTEQLADAEDRVAADTRAHRIRTEELLGRICQILISTHEQVTPADCPTPLAHPADPTQPADRPGGTR